MLFFSSVILPTNDGLSKDPDFDSQHSNSSRSRTSSPTELSRNSYSFSFQNSISFNNTLNNASFLARSQSSVVVSLSDLESDGDSCCGSPVKLKPREPDSRRDIEHRREKEKELLILKDIQEQEASLLGYTFSNSDDEDDGLSRVKESLLLYFSYFLIYVVCTVFSIFNKYAFSLHHIFSINCHPVNVNVFIIKLFYFQNFIDEIEDIVEFEEQPPEDHKSSSASSTPMQERLRPISTVMGNRAASPIPPLPHLPSLQLQSHLPSPRLRSPPHIHQQKHSDSSPLQSTTKPRSKKHRSLAGRMIADALRSCSNNTISSKKVRLTCADESRSSTDSVKKYSGESESNNKRNKVNGVRSSIVVSKDYYQPHSVQNGRDESDLRINGESKRHHETYMSPAEHDFRRSYFKDSHSGQFHPQLSDRITHHHHQDSHHKHDEFRPSSSHHPSFRYDVGTYDDKRPLFSGNVANRGVQSRLGFKNSQFSSDSERYRSSYNSLSDERGSTSGEIIIKSLSEIRSEKTKRCIEAKVDQPAYSSRTNHGIVPRASLKRKHSPLSMKSVPKKKLRVLSSADATLIPSAGNCSVASKSSTRPRSSVMAADDTQEVSAAEEELLLTQYDEVDYEEEIDEFEEFILE